MTKVTFLLFSAVNLFNECFSRGKILQVIFLSLPGLLHKKPPQKTQNNVSLQSKETHKYEHTEKF